MEFDEIDLKILRIIQENARITNAQLSSEVGLSPAPTLERVKKLEKLGVIDGYHAKLNNEAIGLGVEILIQINLVRQMENAIADFKADIEKMPEVTDCYQITGNFDYILKVVVPDIASFEALIANKLSKMDQISQMQSSVILSKVKNSVIAPIEYD